MNLGVYFIVALALSFLGSLPIGLITLTITQRTIQNGRQSGIMIAFGATVMEFVYTFVALVSLDFFTQNTTINDYIKIFAAVIFFTLGLYFLWKKNSAPVSPISEYNYFDFLRGFIVGAMNMLIVPFWIFLGIWLEANGMLFEEKTTFFVFSLGAAIGALLVFFGYIWMGEYVVGRIKSINQYTNRIIGVLFLGLGVFQLTQIL